MAINWYIRLKQLATTDEKAKELLTALETATPETQAQTKETAKSYVESLKSEESSEEPIAESIPKEPVEETKTPVKQPLPEDVDIEKMSEKELMAWRAGLIEEREEHQKTKLADMSYDEKKAYNKKDFKYAVRIAKINERLQLLRKQERVATRKSTETNVLRKQSEFLHMLTHGMSINNIIKKSELIRNVDNLLAIMTADFIEKCNKKYFGFKTLWQRWYAKYVDNAKEKANN